MLDDAGELIEKIRLGEDAYLEYQQVFGDRRVQAPTRNVVADALAAFANSRGSAELSGKKPEYKQIGDVELMLTIFAANPTARSAST